MNPSLESNSMVGNNHISFYSNGIEIDKSKTLKENNIEDNAIILFGYSNIKPVNVNFISNIPQINYKLSCYNIYLFSFIESKLYDEYPELKEKYIIFKVEGNKIDKSLTLDENNIKNDAIISMEIIDGKKLQSLLIQLIKIQNVLYLVMIWNFFPLSKKNFIKMFHNCQKILFYM